MNPIIKGDLSVFTAGWFRGLGSKLRTVVAPYTAGWFSTFNEVNVDQLTQNIYFKSGKHSHTIKASTDYKHFGMMPGYMLKKCSSYYDGLRETYQLLTDDYILKFGVPTQYYYVSYNEDYDRIWGEDNNRYVLKVWDNVMCWYKMQRDNQFWNKFGKDNQIKFTMYIPKKHFESVTDGYIPQAGDLFIENSTGRIMEILDRTEGGDDASWLQSKRYLWEIDVVVYNRVERLGFADETKNSLLAKLINTNVDRYDVTNDIDNKKESVLYDPKPNEKAQQNPWSTW